MVQPILLRGLALSTAALLIACSGTQQGTGTSDLGPGSSETGAGPGGTGTAERAPAAGTQDPGLEKVAEQRRAFLVADGLKKARRALELKLYREALTESGQVLELDPDNDEARQILLSTSEILGEETARIARSIDDKVIQARISLERDNFRARQLGQQADAEVELGRYGDAIDNYEKALLVLEYNPLATPGSALQRELEAKLDRARQQQAMAMQSEIEQEKARSAAELEEAERRKRVERQQRVARLMVQANRDFQLGNYRQAIAALDQAIVLEPTNADAVALHDLASRAQHENQIEVARQRWKQEWSDAMDDINHSLLPQTDAIVFDLDRWAEVRANRKPLQFTPSEELDNPADRAVRSALENTVIPHNFSDASIDDWAKYYAGAAEVNFVISASARGLDESATRLVDFRLGPRPIAQALDVIGAQTGVRWHVRDGVVELVSSEVRTGKTYLVPYEVRDLVQGVKSQPGPKLKLTVPGEDLDSFGFDEDEPAATVVEEDRLQDLIRENIGVDTWEGEPGTMSYQSGVLLVRHTADIHQKIERLLTELRRAVGIQVDVEAKFLKVEDSFLEDIGVDFRGLGDQSSEGVPGRGLEQNNRSNLRFDDFGRPEEINSARPGEIGTGTEPGVFFDDGGDGDLMGRTEHLYDRQLGGGPDGLNNAGGLALQYAYLDDVELEVILRAVQKNERSEEVVSPRLLIYNNSRAHMQALRHTSYIRDFDVEIAQAAAVANPIVDVVRDGVVLDVRPVVSADRRFITMELRPTVMALQFPIPTFTTTLGAGQPVSIQLPDVTLQSVRTTVTMPDGGSILLGGMKLAERQNIVSGVPLLKDLPILSFLFSRKGTFTLNRKIIILIKARIVISEEFEPKLIPDDFDTLLTNR
jgi:type II secretory pathway component GspD/PulD (secretin)